MSKRSGFYVAVIVFAWLFDLSMAYSQERIGVQRHKYEAGGANRYLVIEILDDDLAHFELSETRTGSEPGPQRNIHITPMADARAYQRYPGPTGQGFVRQNNVIETREMTITVEDDARCVRIFDKARHVRLLKMCGEDLNRATKRLRIERQDMQHVYGVGNLFYDGKTADGDWVGRHWKARNHGNFRFGFFITDDGVGSDNFYGGGPSVSQFPIIYALGPQLAGGAFQNYGLFVDQVYRMSWDFHDHTNWYATMWGDQLRWFVMTGPNLKDLRGDFMELVGRPPIPPRHAFGLWISEFGYDNWNEVREDLDSLRANRFPVDGVALDLQWFGGRFDSNEQDGICEPDRMGALRFNLQNFPAPETEIPKFLNQYGVRFMTIEEPLIDNRLPEHAELWSQKFLARVSDVEPVTVTRDFRHEGADDHCVWWGRGGLIDWTNPEARKFWHQQKRLNLSLMGITSHWLDLGEPEMYYQDALYHGFPELGKNRHGDIHNVYNLFWAQGVFEGYRDHDNQQQVKHALGLHEAPRSFTMSRAGTVGSQRYTAMWSGDVAPNMENLRAHLQTQMHMSLAGMDYYSSDAGGFLPPQDGGIEPGQVDELYTQWFANNALLDIPLRPHAWAYGEQNGNIRLAPDQRGHRPSNRANVLLRYELTPYLYSLAHRAHRAGEPIFPPLIYHFQDDPNVRRIGNVKLIGDALLFGVVATFGQTDRRVYLPRGRWADYHSRQWHDSTGAETAPVPLYRERLGQPGAFTIPLFAKAGAIIPQMYVDEKTRTVSRRDVDPATLPNEERQREILLSSELRVKVFAGNTPTSFTLYEDDGITLDYLNGNVRETRITQHADAGEIRVTIHEAQGTFHHAVSSRADTVELIVDGQEATAVEVNGTPLPKLASGAEFEAGKTGWYNAGHNLIRARSEVKPVSTTKNFLFRVSAH